MQVTEASIQKAIVKTLNEYEAIGKLAFSHPPNGFKANPWVGKKFKDQGVKAGQPDLELYFPNARTVFVEIKKFDGGYLSPKQKARHRLLRNLGFVVETIYAKDEDDGLRQISLILKENGV